MTMWSNYHTHSRFCDGKGDLPDYCRKAAEASMTSLGFSSHAPLPFPCTWCMDPGKLQDYLDTIEQIRQTFPQLNIYKGLEVDFIPGVISTTNFKQQLDYSIGSVHFVESFPGGKRWEIDGTRSSFMEGLDIIFKHDIRSAVVRYFDLTRQMISTACPTIVGHLDKIKIQNTGGQLFKETDSWYREEISKTLDLIRQAGCIVEVNTRGLYQKKSPTTYPSPWVLELLLEKDIPITLSSDAHHPDDLINQFPETAVLLRSLGFKKTTTLHEGEWRQVDFTKNGLILEHSRI